MNPVLVLALGSPFAGDDDIGAHVLAAIATDPAVAAKADLAHAGTDLFRCAPLLHGRERIILLDAALGTGHEPCLHVRPHPPSTPGERRTHAHDLDPVAALELLRRSEPEIAGAECWWVLVEVPEIHLRRGISPAARALVEAAAARLRALVSNSDTAT